jgi:hypothetical protein
LKSEIQEFKMIGLKNSGAANHSRMAEASPSGYQPSTMADKITANGKPTI